MQEPVVQRVHGNLTETYVEPCRPECLNQPAQTLLLVSTAHGLPSRHVEADEFVVFREHKLRDLRSILFEGIPQARQVRRAPYKLRLCPSSIFLRNGSHIYFVVLGWSFFAALGPLTVPPAIALRSCWLRALRPTVPKIIIESALSIFF